MGQAVTNNEGFHANSWMAGRYAIVCCEGADIADTDRPGR